MDGSDARGRAFLIIYYLMHLPIAVCIHKIQSSGKCWSSWWRFLMVFIHDALCWSGREMSGIHAHISTHADDNNVDLLMEERSRFYAPLQESSRESVDSRDFIFFVETELNFKRAFLSNCSDATRPSPLKSFPLPRLYSPSAIPSTKNIPFLCNITRFVSEKWKRIPNKYLNNQSSRQSLLFPSK